ncbi:ester cyclase [Nonomuraea aridisoli]|nr:nuclear transport factor 2 family protein [Nonomuraea aridisoli]
MPDVVDRLLDAVNAHDMEAVARCYSAQAVMIGPELQADGPEEIRSYHDHVWEGFPDIRMTVWERLEQNDTVVLEGAFTGTHEGRFLISEGRLLEPTGNVVNFRFCWLFTKENDLISAHRAYHDQAEIYHQLGIRFVPVTA